MYVLHHFDRSLVFSDTQVTPPLPTVLATCPVIQFEVSVVNNSYIFRLSIMQ